MNRQAEFDRVMDASSGVAALAALTKTECEQLWEHLLLVPQGGLVVEVGCQLGRSSSLIIEAKKLISYHSIHIDPYTQQPEYAKGWIEMMMRIGGEWDHEFVLCCMRTSQAQWLISKMGEIDLAFIDGDHSYEGVKWDMDIIGRKIRRNGILLAHDVDHVDYPGVRKAIEELTGNPGWHFVGQFDSLGAWIRK